MTNTAVRHPARTRAVRRRRRLISAAIMRAISIETEAVVKRFAAALRERAPPGGRRWSRPAMRLWAPGLTRRLTCRISFMQRRGKAQTKLGQVAADVIAVGHHAPLDPRQQVAKGAFAHLAGEAAVSQPGEVACGAGAIELASLARAAHVRRRISGAIAVFFPSPIKPMDKGRCMESGVGARVWRMSWAHELGA
jgi:hypothetical protein